MSEKPSQPEHPHTAPVQGQMYIPPQYYQAPEDEIDLRELFAVLWKGKWWIIGITALFAIASVFYALSLPNEYKATAIVAPASKGKGGSLNSVSGQIGALAAKYAGVSLGAAETSDAVIAMNIMKTWGFIDEFINKHNLQVPIYAAVGWDESNNELIINDQLYDVTRKEWVRDATQDKTKEPTSWELYEKFSERVSVHQDLDSGLVVINFMHYSPEYSQKITQWIIEDVNALLKERALDESAKNISYLEAQIERTPLSEMRNVFYSLIAEQTKTRMLADVSDEYVFKYVSHAMVPEMKSKPKRAIICIIGVLLGSLVSLFFIVVKSLFSRKIRK